MLSFRQQSTFKHTKWFDSTNFLKVLALIGLKQTHDYNLRHRKTFKNSDLAPGAYSLQ